MAGQLNKEDIIPQLAIQNFLNAISTIIDCHIECEKRGFDFDFASILIKVASQIQDKKELVP